MTAKRENTYIGNIHRHLPGGVYAEKTNNPYRGGTPDCYYESRFMAWVEYKFNELPKRGTTLMTPNLTPLQADWLRRAHDNGHRCGVIMGAQVGRHSVGVFIRTPGVWLHGISADEFVASAKSTKEMAEVITALVSP